MSQGSYSRLYSVFNEATRQCQLSLSPNPSRGLYELSIENLRGTAKLEVLDALGRLVYEGEVGSQDLKTHQQLDLRSAAVGIYTLRLQSSDGSKYLRLKKE